MRRCRRPGRRKWRRGWRRPTRCARWAARTRSRRGRASAGRDFRRNWGEEGGLCSEEGGRGEPQAGPRETRPAGFGCEGGCRRRDEEGGYETPAAAQTAAVRPPPRLKRSHTSVHSSTYSPRGWPNSSGGGEGEGRGSVAGAGLGPSGGGHARAHASQRGRTKQAGRGSCGRGGSHERGGVASAAPQLRRRHGCAAPRQGGPNRPRASPARSCSASRPRLRGRAARRAHLRCRSSPSPAGPRSPHQPARCTRWVRW